MPILKIISTILKRLTCAVVGHTVPDRGGKSDQWMSSHTWETYFKCNRCGEKFYTGDNLGEAVRKYEHRWWRQ